MTETKPFVPVRPHRTYEDLSVGEFRRSRERTVTQDEILRFARDYDPQWFHSDAELARGSVFGELVASGIHVLALWRQLDHEINSDIDFVCGVGWDDLRLRHAIRAGDTIHVTSEIVALAPVRKRQAARHRADPLRGGQPEGRGGGDLHQHQPRLHARGARAGVGETSPLPRERSRALGVQRRWSKRRPSMAPAMLTFWMSIAPPAMPQPQLSRSRRSIGNSLE